jgi:formamidopyrimidine-DNA glycosylase
LTVVVDEAAVVGRRQAGQRGAQVSRAALARLVPEVRAVLEEAIRAGGSTLRDYVRPDGELGYFAKDWRVYGREGEPCGCGKRVERLVQGGRSTFFCGSCQK